MKVDPAHPKFLTRRLGVKRGVTRENTCDADRSEPALAERRKFVLPAWNLGVKQPLTREEIYEDVRLMPHEKEVRDKPDA